MNRDLFKQDIPRMSMVDRVVERIKTLLIEQKLKPGDMLPSENVLAERRHYRELIDLRAMMERGIVNLVIRYATDEELEELSQVLKKMEELSKTEKEGHQERDKADLEFHKILGKLCKNSMIENIYTFVMELFAPTINATYGLEEHTRLLQALRERNIEKAAQYIDQHTRVWCQVNGIQY